MAEEQVESNPKEQSLMITQLPNDMFAVWFDECDVERKQCFTATKILSVKVKYYEEDGEPLLRVSRERMQKVMNDLWKFGLRPEEYDGRKTE